jgi:hypothetical protein
LALAVLGLKLPANAQSLPTRFQKLHSSELIWQKERSKPLRFGQDRTIALN